MKKTKVKDAPANTLVKKEKKGFALFLEENKFILLAFAVPFVLMGIAFAVKDVAPFGIFKTMYESVLFQIGKIFPSLNIETIPNTAKPWGTNQMLVVDLWHQYYPFLYDLHEKLQSGGSLFWTWSIGMGTNFIALMSYYLLSPLNFISVIIPDGVLVEYLCVATVIKIACAGMFTAISFKIVTKQDGWPLVFAGVMFALCSFNMGYYWNVIWLDSVAMFPLVFAGTVCLLREGKFKLFTISLALSVIFNYYIGFIICIAVLLICLGYTVARFVSLKKSLKDLLRTVVCSLTALLFTAPVTVPAYLALQNCYQQTTGFPKSFDINIAADNAEGVFEAIHLIFSNLVSFIDPNYKEGLPNVACGVFCIILLAVFFCSRKIKLGEKFACLGGFLLLVASFIFRHLDYIWHGFHYPNMIPYRFSFLLCFLLIFMAFRAYTLLCEKEYIDIIAGAVVFGLIIFGYFLREPEKFDKGAIIATILVGVAMVIVLLLFSFKLLPKKVASVILCLIIIGEMGANAIIGVNTVSVTTMTGYPKEEKTVSRIVDHIEHFMKEDPDWARTEVNATQSLNDGALNNYHGISVFNSMANVNVNNYGEYLGLAGWPAGNRYTYYQSSPVTNVILNLKYLIDRDGKVYDHEYWKEIDSVGSVKLYENQAYLPQGFLVGNALEYFDASITGGNPGTVENPIENQIAWWKAATGITEPVYTQLTVTDVGHSGSDELKIDKHSEGHYTAYPQNGASPHVKFNYYLEEDAVVVGYMKVGSNDGEGSILINDQTQSSRNVKTAHIMNIGNHTKGTKVSLYGKIESSASYSSIRVYCYTLNKEVFEKGMEILGENTLDCVKATDTVLEGTINSQKAGILYTSIPYEKGWSVTVDGEKAEIIPIGGGVCGVKISQGFHRVRFSYTPDGFVIGVSAFSFALLMFALFCVFTSKKFSQKIPQKVNVAAWLFDPTVNSKKDSSEGDFSEEPKTGTEPEKDKSSEDSPEN